MATYAVMLHKSAGHSFEDAVLVREGFRFWAAALGPFWLVYHRSWRGLAGWCAAVLVILLLWAPGFLRPEAVIWLIEAVALFLGLQGQSLIETALQRRRYEVVDVVTGDSLREAERIFFRRVLTGHAGQARPATPAPVFPGTDSIIGLFPMSEARP
jgi:hypothetical protein